MTSARYILLIATASFFAVLGVAQRAHNVHLGLAVARLQAERDALVESNRVLLCEVNALAQPGRIAGRAQRLPVGLMDPVALTLAPLEDAPH